ncbi:unnamed protein product [Eruca vesicaria subsp. sativa]|uniref:Uncharacterized protein n=1 Tax=Eruca vesicaria subsp. sativa TaxID=29727 RepID=A0ABC8JUU5_ERUVS|nr:unnamed protein product [Eruca vesicaria subsp. sativa]
MAECNKLSEVTYNPEIRSWRFRMQLHRIYPYAITNHGPYYNYILTYEDGYKMEMTTDGDYPNFRGLEKEEGRWVEIFVVEVEQTYPCFQPTSSPFRLNASRCTTLYNSVDIKCVVTGDQAYAFRDGHDYMSGGGRRQVIVALKMWRVWKFMCYFGPPEIWFETEDGFVDFRFNPRLPKVEEFMQSLLNSDPYVQKYGVEGLV